MGFFCDSTLAKFADLLWSPGIILISAAPNYIIKLINWSRIQKSVMMMKKKWKKDYSTLDLLHQSKDIFPHVNCWSSYSKKQIFGQALAKKKQC